MLQDYTEMMRPQLSRTLSDTKILYSTHSCIPARLIVPTSRHLLVMYLYSETAPLDAVPRDGHTRFLAGTHHPGVELLLCFVFL